MFKVTHVTVGRDTNQSFRKKFKRWIARGTSSTRGSQSWDCSQVEHEPDEKDPMNCLLDHEMMRQWEEARNGEEQRRHQDLW